MEPLEPRLLLSADFTGSEFLASPEALPVQQALQIDPAQESLQTHKTDPSLVLSYLAQTEDQEAASTEDALASPAGASLPDAEALPKVQDRFGAALEATLGSQGSALQSQNESSCLVVVDQQDTMSSPEDSPVEARAPPTRIAPDLPGLQLVDPNPDNLVGQTIYLEFDGAQGVFYEGPVRVGPVDIPAFRAPVALSGEKEAIILATVAKLNRIYAGSGVTFTAEKPEPGTVLSVIYVGGDDSAFRVHGSFLGLAEHVDVGNADRSDKAFVFSDNIIAAGRAAPSSLTTDLSDLLCHEAGHILGYEHAEMGQHAESGGECSVLSYVAAPFGGQSIISTQAVYAQSVYACDLDGDGDNDVLSASWGDDKIAWYENLGGGTFGSQKVISTQAYGAWSVYACDLDGDGDIDVLSASSEDDKIAWYENLGGGTFGPQQIISTLADYALFVYACDLDGDGDNDVLSASRYDDKIAWYENLGGGVFGSQQVITTEANDPQSVYACDMDGDGDNDVLSASRDDDKIAWYENLGGGTFGSQQVISTQAIGAWSVYTCDLDGDGDNDVLSASVNDDKIAWYENLGSGTFGPQQVISTQARTAFCVFACDLDGDGDNDVLSASANDDKITWYANLGAGTFGSQQIISTLADGAYSVYACDLDGDGDNDVLSASFIDDKIAWYENQGSPEIDVELGATDNIHSYDFDIVDVGQVASQEFTIHNEGNAILVVNQAAGLVSPFSISPVNGSGGGDDWYIPAGGTQTFTVTFSPVSAGDYSDTLVLISNDSDEGSYEIVFEGTGFEPGSISGYKFEDINGNGLDDSEPDLAGWTIALYLDDGDGIFNETTPIATQVTSSPDGAYSFTGLAAGDYWVREVPQSDWIQTTVNPSLITIGSGDHITEADDLGLAFGNKSGIFGPQQVITTAVNAAWSVYACDLDGDGDNDVLSASYLDDKIAWYENLGGGTFGPQQIISTLADYALSIYACDLDGDGDNDVLSASRNDDKIAWY